jgi:hypothetical protein
MSKEIHATLIETLGEHAPSYATVRNWVGPVLNEVIFPPVMCLLLDEPKQLPPEIIDQIHELILEDHWPDFG